jgi:hypothetical protein
VASLVGLLQSITPLSMANQSVLLGDARLIDEGAPMAVSPTAAAGPWAPDFTVSTLSSIIHAGAWPTDLAVTNQDLLEAASYLQVSLTPTPVTPSGAAPSVLSEFGPLVRSDGGDCVSLASPGGQPEVGLNFASPGSVEVIAAESGTVSVQVAWPSRPGALTAAQSLWIPEGRAYLNVTAAGTIAILMLPAGAYQLCGVSLSGPSGPDP